MAESNETLSLKINQLAQITEQNRVAIYNLELKNALLIKMLEEKGLMAISEFEKRWPLYLRKDVGVVGQDGVMDGFLKTTFYE